MANKTEFSRLVTKGSSVSGVTPTINSGDTIDATWIDSDILNREMFINVEDKKVFIRANDDILEFNTFGTGSTAFDFCSTGVKSDSYSACTDTGFLSLAYSGFGGDIMITSSGESENRFIRMSSNISEKPYSTILINNPDGFIQGNSQRFDVFANSAMNLLSDSINVYRNSDDTGFDIYSDAITFYDANGDSPLFLSSSGVLPALGTGTSISNIGVNSNGFIVTASTFNGLDYLPLSGGTMDSGSPVYTNTGTKVINFGISGFSDDLLLIGDTINPLIPPSAGTSSVLVFYPSGFTGNAVRLNNLDSTNELESSLTMDITGGLSGNIDLRINDNPFGSPNFISRIKIDTNNIGVFNTEGISVSANNGIYSTNSGFNANSGIATLSANENINNTESQLSLTADSGTTFGRFIVSNGLDQVNLDLDLGTKTATLNSYEDATGNQSSLYISPNQVIIASNTSSIILDDSIPRMRIYSSYFTVNNDAFFQKSNSFTSVTTSNFSKQGASICSQNSTINQSVNNSVILGGSLITATTSNTVYVPDLVITKSAAVPTSSGDTVGVVGSVTWDDNYLYTKTNTGWGRVALDYGF